MNRSPLPTDETSPGGFVRRHVGPDPARQHEMLALLGCASLAELTDRVIPRAIRLGAPPDLPDARSEAAVLAALREIAERNAVFRSCIGMGYHPCHTPPVILRNVLENPAWYTSYTPYQAEISQGRLEALLNFQTMVTELTGLDIANASLLDEATAAAEAMTLCRRVSTVAGRVFLVDADCHPQTLDVMRTRAEPLGIEIATGDPADEFSRNDCFGVLIQYPGSSGAVRSPARHIAQAHAAGALVVMAADPLALVMLRPPGEWGADVAVGSMQRFGVPLGGGGPHAAYFATRDAYKRDMPGRLVGVAVDSHGLPATRLALQTREQHIRRERATSNICTAQALLAIMASMYAVYHGPDGLLAIARSVHARALRLADGLATRGHRPRCEAFFDTITIDAGGAKGAILAAARKQRINLRDGVGALVGISLDETSTDELVDTLIRLFPDHGIPAADWSGAGVPVELVRTSKPLRHPIFSSHHSETELLRYLRALSDRDLALDRTMIPLGSCTMKLNATAEMIPITWPGFADIHPYAPAEQLAGYRALTEDLERWLCACTGYDAFSLQPNAGSQGEYAGLLAIRAWHRSRGDHARNVCLIPSSAHGTNPASAHMAGMDVAVVQCDQHGNIDLADLRAKAGLHAPRLAAIMITYPSTHGVFEESVREVCDIVHAHGGQVYIDGANLNAQVGLCGPGHYGGDVSHLNLHKTFCIPHGGGGPGVGPVGVKAHLAPFLPGRPGSGQGGAVAAAPWGSAGILPIAWAYIALMGATGLRHASEVAILSANYVARRLADHYPLLYVGRSGLVAHECILDLRPFKDSAGVTVEDVAKRLIDYGFHAPTMSFPVAGTLMIEPTESEPKAELDRFCAAMIAIREEIRAVETGAADREDNPLKHAPHTAASLVGDWRHTYSREQAVFPVPELRLRKYWPPVGRVDNVWGDRNLMCVCPAPTDDLEQAP